MGDLILKPASSGSLKIQDQAGTNFITTGTSSGLTLDSGVTFPTGHVIQVTSQPNSYPHALSGMSSRSSDLAVQSASSVDWELTLSNVIQGNKILITGMVQFSRDSANGNPAFKLQMKVDSNSYANVALGDALGSRTRLFGGTRASDEYHVHSAAINYLCSPSISGSTGTVKFKIMVSQGAGTARDCLINYTGNNSAEGYTAISVLTGMEIQG